MRYFIPHEHAAGTRTVMLDGRVLPSQVGATVSGQVRVLCLGPADWLIVSDTLIATHIYEQVVSDMRRQGLAVVEVECIKAAARIFP